MLSYQHLYHAGNLADVHKHALLAWMLAYLARKDKPLSYIETHAGRGLYQLDDPAALKTGEAASGITRAEAAGLFAPEDPYRRHLDRCRAAHGAAAYPGSPLIAAQALRGQDRAFLAELHPGEYAALRTAMSGFSAVECRQADGFELALSLCPPQPRRGLMLIDPSYEIKDDYARIPEAIAAIARRWNVGIIALWYPILRRTAHNAICATLRHSFPQAFFHEIGFAPARPGHGMIGSGLCVINPPWGLAEAAAALTEKLTRLGPPAPAPQSEDPARAGR